MLILCTVIIGLAFAAPVAGAAPGNGNSANAKLCQKGGWATLARTEDPGTHFVDQSECVSYGAGGGVLTAYVPPPPAISVEMVRQGNQCVPHVRATNFAPNTTYVGVQKVFRPGVVDLIIQPVEVTTDGMGDVSFTAISNSPAVGLQVHIEVTIDGTSSPATLYNC